MMPMPSKNPPLRQFAGSLGDNLQRTLSKAPKGALVTPSNKKEDRKMFTVAIKIQASHETHHVKTITVALGALETCLQHRVCTGKNHWVSHLSDFFNVLDYPIQGYNSKEVFTEFHLHMWNCVIDYRPLYLPLRTAITVGSFKMSSHLSTQANVSVLTFIAEDCAMFLSDKGCPKKGVPSSLPIELKSDYVMVVNFGLFEFSLRTTDKTEDEPHMDLRASTNGIHIRTCADSAKKLIQLVMYYADDGDLTCDTEFNVSSGSNHSSPRHAPCEQQLVNVENAQDVSNVSKVQQERVESLLDDAMRDIDLNEGEGDSSALGNGANLFFFPDEHLPGENNVKVLPQVKTDLGDITYHTGKKAKSDSDDDFVMVGEELGIGTVSKRGEPQVRYLSEDPVRMCDDHFHAPSKRADVLDAPKNFPTPVVRYTLCDMSVVWHLYGGNDFSIPGKETKKRKTVNFADTEITGRVSYSVRNNSDGVHFSHANRNTNVSGAHWYLVGGVNRDHKILMELRLSKIRCCHEAYPQETKQASRQVLTIGNFEICDKLTSSKINKFLYRHSSKTMPKQTHASMLTIKAIHERTDVKEQECRVTINLQPLRLNIDQDAISFLTNYFNALQSDSDSHVGITPPKQSTPVHHVPIMSVDEGSEMAGVPKIVADENLLIMLEESATLLSDGSSTTESAPNTGEDSSPIFFREVYFTSDVPIKIDYEGKHIDTTHGKIAGTVMGFTHLNETNIKLKRLRNRQGLLGVKKVIEFLVKEWKADIKKNQLQNIIGSIGPVPIFINLFQGFRDLFYLPIQQFQKDGRIVRGFQRGCSSFASCAASASVQLSTRLLGLIQSVAETAYDMLQPGPNIRQLSKGKGQRKRHSQPQDIREGVANAFALVKAGIEETADDIVQAASREHEHKGYAGAVGGVLRQIPSTVVKPIIVMTEATSNVLGGVHNQLVPDARTEANQKWKNPHDE